MARAGCSGISAAIVSASAGASSEASARTQSVMEQARSTANPNRRAALMVAAEKINNQLLPWIPNVQPTNLLLLSKNLTGAVAVSMFMAAGAPRALSTGY